MFKFLSKTTLFLSLIAISSVSQAGAFVLHDTANDTNCHTDHYGEYEICETTKGPLHVLGTPSGNFRYSFNSKTEETWTEISTGNIVYTSSENNMLNLFFKKGEEQVVHSVSESDTCNFGSGSITHYSLHFSAGEVRREVESVETYAC